MPELAGGTTHFIFLGLSISAETWKPKDVEITRIKRRFGVQNAEIHTGWIARRYQEQEVIAGFATMSEAQRRAAVTSERDRRLMKKLAISGARATQELRKAYRKSEPFIHLGLNERIELLRQLLDSIAVWPDCTLFCEAIDKTVFRGTPPRTPPFEEGFSNVVSRFQRYLVDTGQEYGLLVQDHNETMAKRLTQLMRYFHADGTRWTTLQRLVETPLFVDSQLTSMVQMADLCAYSIRRFCENGETDFYDRIRPRFHVANGRMVGIRHYTGTRRCGCDICRCH